MIPITKQFFNQNPNSYDESYNYDGNLPYWLPNANDDDPEIYEENTIKSKYMDANEDEEKEGDPDEDVEPSLPLSDKKLRKMRIKKQLGSKK